jgi:hypothetical protein
MKTKHFLALATLITAQASAFAAPGTFSGPLTFTMTGGFNGHEVMLKQALTGDTSNCIIHVDTGDKTRPQFSVDTHINGLKDVDRLIQYPIDGHYTYHLKAVSGCTGEARVSFQVGSAKSATPVAAPAAGVSPRPAAGLTGLPAPVIATVNPNLTLAHTKITKLVVPAKVAFGQPVVAQVYGTGNEANCKTRVSIYKATAANTFTPQEYGAILQNTGNWPRTTSFKVAPGNYRVSISVDQGNADETSLCGATTLTGQDSMVVVADEIAK